MTERDLIPHLFKKEFGKIVAVLSKTYGLQQIELAEDVAGETFLAALDTWPYQGTPANPTAWLYTVAKNKLTNQLNRQQNFQKKIASQLDTAHHEIDLNFSEKNITDSQLQMLFALCHPSLPLAAQICLALRILGGLGLDEIATALLSNTETIHKKLQRAKKKIKEERLVLEFPDEKALQARLEAVMQVIYIIFSEGYYSENHQQIIRKDLCVEALNLAYLLLQNEQTNHHASNALMALLCFQSSRLAAREQNGDMVLYAHQNRALWDSAFIEKGFYYLQQASKWPISSDYYLEASIAYWHTVSDENVTKWPSILQLYEGLIKVDASPIVALNRIWALAKVDGAEAALKILEQSHFKKDRFYYLLLAELHKENPIQTSRVEEYLTKALKQTKNEAERKNIMERLAQLKK